MNENKDKYQVCSQGLNNFFGNTNSSMADITSKSSTYRRAIAVGSLKVSAQAMDRVVGNTMPKGDPRVQAEFAAICAAKKTADLLPLCHPLPLESVGVRIITEQRSNTFWVVCSVATTASTGVEMEALTAVQVGLLTLYDMIKPVEANLVIEAVRLVFKEGGKKGQWIHKDGVPDILSDVFVDASAPKNQSKQLASAVNQSNLKAMVITVSDRCFSGERKDISGVTLSEMVESLGIEVVNHTLIPDEKSAIEKTVLMGADELAVNLIVTTGGTGAAPRDITPDSILPLCDRIIPGYGERLRSYGANSLPQSWLSRSFAATRNQTLIVALPGSTGGVKDGINAIAEILPDTLTLISGQGCSKSG